MAVSNCTVTRQNWEIEIECNNVDKALPKNVPVAVYQEEPTNFDTMVPMPAHELETNENLPRIVNDGIIPMQSREIIREEGPERAPGDLARVAVLIQYSEFLETERMIYALKSQRKHQSDLPIYIFSEDNNVVTTKMRRKWKRQLQANFVFEKSASLAIQAILVDDDIDFFILLNDTDKIGADFGDFYFLGKELMRFHTEIESICGNGNGEEWQDASFGDVLWISQSECQMGKMVSRASADFDFRPKTGVSLRPEVGRVGKTTKSVTNSTWNLSKFDLRLLKIDDMERRMEYEFMAATKELDSLYDLKAFDSDVFYSFPYKNISDFYYFFDKNEIQNFHAYKGVISLTIYGRHVFLLPQKIYENPYFP
ncbi:unnamed protein product [Caenorhabditis sp. 36 PRJEB53466]|nr:unnamed protein product [Caenorhabditis sp. 36 PRJEB53466]